MNFCFIINHTHRCVCYCVSLHVYGGQKRVFLPLFFFLSFFIVLIFIYSFIHLFIILKLGFFCMCSPLCPCACSVDQDGFNSEFHLPLPSEYGDWSCVPLCLAFCDFSFFCLSFLLSSFPSSWLHFSPFSLSFSFFYPGLSIDWCFQRRLGWWTGSLRDLSVFI